MIPIKASDTIRFIFRLKMMSFYGFSHLETLAQLIYDFSKI